MEQKWTNLSKWISVALAVMFAAFMAHMIALPNAEKLQPVEPLGFVGTYQESEAAAPRALPEDYRLDIASLSSLILRGHFTRDIPAQETVHLKIRQMNVSIRQNGQEIYAYGGEGTHPEIVRAVGNIWVSFLSPGISAGDEIEIEITSAYGDMYSGAYTAFLEELRTGDTYALMHRQVTASFWQIFISLLIFFVGLALLAAIGTLRLIKAPVQGGYFSCGMLLLCSAVCTLIDYDYITLIFPNAFVVNLIDNLSQLFICYFLLVYLRSCLRGKRFRVTVTVFINIWSALLIAYFFLQGMGVLDVMEILSILLPIAIAIIGVTLFFLMKEVKLYNDWRVRNVIYSSALFTACALAELVHYYIAYEYWMYLFEFGAVVFMVAQFVTMMHYTMDGIAKAAHAEAMERELLQSRVALTLKQIRPHFIFNALNAISGLCSVDPEKADDAIISFSDYLRGNIDALQSGEPVRFTEELQHIRHYLALEALRFGDRLKVTYDIGYSRFSLPALTVQPIVENAVKHGVGGQLESCTVHIKTEKAGDKVVITVRDDGPGFDTSTLENHGEHLSVGLENVRSRLAYLAQGTLKVDSVIGQGTTVTIEIRA